MALGLAPADIVGRRVTQLSIGQQQWVCTAGRMSTRNKSTRFGAAAYTLAGEEAEIYKY